MRTIYHNYFLDGLCTKFGDAPVDAVVKAYGGRSVAVASNPTNRWIKIVGEDVAAWIAETFGGNSVCVPTLATLQRKREVSAKHHQIQTSDEEPIALARRYQISVRQVHNIKAQRRDPRLT